MFYCLRTTNDFPLEKWKILSRNPIIGTLHWKNMKKKMHWTILFHQKEKVRDFLETSFNLAQLKVRPRNQAKSVVLILAD